MHIGKYISDPYGNWHISLLKNEEKSIQKVRKVQLELILNAYAHWYVHLSESSRDSNDCASKLKNYTSELKDSGSKSSAVQLFSPY